MAILQSCNLAIFQFSNPAIWQSSNLAILQSYNLAIWHPPFPSPGDKSIMGVHIYWSSSLENWVFQLYYRSAHMKYLVSFISWIMNQIDHRNPCSDYQKRKVYIYAIFSFINESNKIQRNSSLCYFNSEFKLYSQLKSHLWVPATIIFQPLTSSYKPLLALLQRKSKLGSWTTLRKWRIDKKGGKIINEMQQRLNLENRAIAPGNGNERERCFKCRIDLEDLEK